MAKATKAAQALKPPTLAGLTAEMDDFRKEIRDLVQSMKESFAKHYGETQEQLREVQEQVADGFEMMDRRAASHERLLIGLLNVLNYKDVLSSEELAKLVIPDEEGDGD